MGLPKDSPFYPIPSDRVILETANCLAFYDAYPVSRGHALVVPLRPVLSIYELDAVLQAELWDTVRQVRQILAGKFSPDGFNVGVNDGRAAGQTVPHAHIHVIPRYAGDVADPRGGVRWVPRATLPARFSRAKILESVTPRPRIHMRQHRTPHTPQPAIGEAVALPGSGHRRQPRRTTHSGTVLCK